MNSGVVALVVACLAALARAEETTCPGFIEHCNPDLNTCTVRRVSYALDAGLLAKD